jgi:uncharacterized protein YybS (DUF2232 family)
MARSRQLWPVALAAAILIAAGALGDGLGPAGLVSFLLPVPVAYLAFRRGAAEAMAAAAAAGVVSGLLWGAAFGLALFVVAVSTGVLIAQGLRSAHDPLRTVAEATGFVLAAAAVFLVVEGLVLSRGHQPLAALDQIAALRPSFEASVRKAIATALEQQGMAQAVARRRAAAMARDYVPVFLSILPGLFALSVAINMALAYGLTRLLLPRQELPVWPPFVRWATPLWLPPVFLVSMAAVLWSFLGGSPLVAAVGWNVLLVTGPPLVLHGLAVVQHAAQRLRTPGVLVFVILLTVLFLPSSLVILAWLGVADSLSDFRRLRSHERG